MRFLPEYSSLILSFIFFQKTKVFDFSWHVIWLVCFMALIFFYSIKKLGQDNPINTLNVFVRCVEMFLETSEKKVLPPKMKFLPESSSLMLSFIFFKKTHSGCETFFQRSLEIFLHILQSHSRYSEGCPDLALWASKRIKTIRRTNQNICKEKSKTFVFLRKWILK